MSKGGCDTVGSLHWSRPLAGPVPSGEEPMLEQVSWQDLWAMGDHAGAEEVTGTLPLREMEQQSHHAMDSAPIPHPPAGEGKKTKSKVEPGK